MKKRTRRMAAWIVALLVMMPAGAVVYADTYDELHELRDTEIELLLPETWECNEVGKEISSGEICEWIAETYDDAEDDCLYMDLYYMHDGIGESQSFDMSEKDSALEYYDAYGESNLETLFLELDWIENVSIGEVAYFEGNYNSMLKIPVKGFDSDGYDYYGIVYMDGVKNYENSTIVHRIMLFYKDYGELNKTQLNTAEHIADNFYDYGYYEDGYFGKDSGLDFEGLSFILTFGIILLGIIGTAIEKIPEFLGKNSKKRKKKKEKKSDPAAPVKMKRIDKKRAEQRWSEQKAAGSNSYRKTVESKETRKAMSSEERYMESLRTLRKSGLLTKEEMQDMLERHERNKSKRRSK